VRSPFVIGLIIGAVLVALAAYFLPERETTIARDVRTEEIRGNVELARPFVKELKDFKEVQK
jgi:hypothetical protein